MHPFVSLTRRMGENLIRETGGVFKASLRSSTRATYSLANRACFFEGLAESGAEVGEYITRESDGKTYLVETRQPEPRCPALEYLYLALCNQRVDLARCIRGGSGDGDRANRYEVYAEGVPVFMDTSTRSYKEQNDGLLDNSIYVLHLPARYGIRKMDRVYIHAEGVTPEARIFYRVDSINDALTPIDEVDTNGIDVLQLSNDARVDSTQDNNRVDGDGNPISEGRIW